MSALASFPDVEIEPGVYFASDAILIGDARWRIVVKDSAFGARRFAYEWHPIGHLPTWREHSRWPSFDLLRQDYGLPASLAGLYAVNELAVKQAIVGFYL